MTNPLLLNYDIVNTNIGVAFTVFPAKEHPLFRYLEGGFSCYLAEEEKYIQAYLNNEFLTSTSLIIKWEKSLYFKANINNIIKHNKNKIKKIVVGHNDLEYIAKMRTFLSYYEWSSEQNQDTLFSNYDTLLLKNKQEVKFEFKIEEVNIEENKEDFEITFKCIIKFTNMQHRKLDFEIKCYSPTRIYNKAKHSQNSLFFPSHIICNRLDIKEIKAFLTNLVEKIKASSVSELKLKLAATTNSFYTGRELSKVITAGDVNKFELKRFQGLHPQNPPN